jgi:MFS superfamily sulfate permease-like transporter
VNGFELVAIVIGVFFVFGIAVGMLLVVALPLLRSLRRRRDDRRYLDGGDWREPGPPREDDLQPPRWPGG